MGQAPADVLVVGTGPMGATTALALATYGVRVQAVSKWNWLANTPRAHITNQRAAEVLRDLGVEEEVKALATPWGEMGDTLFTTSLAGPEIARLRTWGTGDERSGDYRRGSPCTHLDLVGKGRFTLLTGLSGEAWRQAHADLGASFLRLVVVGSPGVADPYCVWGEASGIEEAGVLLVRPDGYVAWRVREAVWDAMRATALLRTALCRVLSLEGPTWSARRDT